MIWEKDATRIVEKLQKSRKLLNELFETISEDEWLKVIIGEEWSVNDIVIHLIGWDEYLVAQAKVWLLGKVPKEANISDDEYNKKYIKEHPVESKKEAIAKFRKSTSEMFKFLNGLSDEQRKYAIENESLVDLDLYEHDMEHYYSIIKALKR